ncbi:MAG: 2-isopropylmalate synthase, partial [Planctomycetes bacterium]|nr:2-isopropylmalate synthase [Planctomycetota bacterium]
MPNDRVHIFDTTLRDGEQSPGASMTTPEKLRVAGALARLGVDVIEAGFPAASPDDKNAVSEVAQTVGSHSDDGPPPIIAGLARATRGDIDACSEALVAAARPRIHVFIATSPIHREHKLRMSRDEVLAHTREAVAYARELADDVEFSAEDAGRTEPEFLYEIVEAAIDAGAGVINIPDTVGYTLPDEFGGLIANIGTEVRGAERAIISVHCHDDLGLAVANTLAGIRAGARQAEGPINGLGARAGNASLEEVVMAIRARHDQFGLDTGIEATELVPTSRLVSQVTGMAVQANKAIVGRNAFAHEAGIHQDGVLKLQQTYEIISPE